MPLNREFLVERQGRQLALYAGLLDLAHQEGLRAITTELVQAPTEANGQLAVCRATVVTEKGTFTGLGDACPANVSRPMVPHLLRLAETRAKARALRDAVNVGVAAVEELGEPAQEAGDGPPDVPGAGPRRLRPPRPPEPAIPAPPAPGAPAWPAQVRGLAAGPAVVDPEAEASEQQHRLLRELAGRAPGREVPAGLTRAQASALIDRWKSDGPRP